MNARRLCYACDDTATGTRDRRRDAEGAVVPACNRHADVVTVAKCEDCGTPLGNDGKCHVGSCFYFSGTDAERELYRGLRASELSDEQAATMVEILLTDGARVLLHRFNRNLSASEVDLLVAARVSMLG